MRKRFLLLLALATALLLAAGTATAMATTADDGHAHWAWCDAKDVCAVCGAAYDGGDIRHEEGEFQCDETAHWYICLRCGEAVSRLEHRAYCSNPGVCLYCGEPYSGNNVEHIGGYEFQGDETEHWLVCTACNEVMSWGREEHSAYCNEHVCMDCGLPYFGDNVTHPSASEEVRYNKLEHWFICAACGYEFPWGRERHYANCSNPDVCAICGQPYSGSNIQHSYGSYQYNETAHWLVCADCNEISELEEHATWCDTEGSGTCVRCGQPCSGSNVIHSEDLYWEYNDTEHWQVCPWCSRELSRGEHWEYCGRPGVCGDCGQPYSGSKKVHYDDPDSTYQHDETNHWKVCTECGEKYNVEAHSFGNDGVCTVCEYSEPVVTDAPTEAPTEAPTATPTAEPTEVPTEKPTEAPTEVPTEKPTEKPTEAPTEVPTEKPTEAPTEVPTEKPTEAPTEVPTEKPTEVPTEVPTEKPTEAPTEVPTEKPTEAPTEVPTEKPTEAPTEVPTEAPTAAPTDAPTAAPTAEPTQAPHEHIFRTFVSRGDGTHRSDCEGCGTFTVENCLMQSRTVNGVSCQVCSACGYTVVSALPAIELPEAPVAEAAAVTEAGEEASILVFDVTASLPEDSAFALCLQVMPQEGPALPGSVRITVPCTLDTANLRLVFIPEDGLPVEVPFEVIDGMLTFTADVPGVFALVPVQE